MLSLVPKPELKNATTNDTKGSLGLHDTFAYGPRSLAVESKSGGLEHRIQNWEETQDNLKLTLRRNNEGLHAPMRIMMERSIVARNPHMPMMPTSNLHLDILMGRDELIEPVDIFLGPETGPPLDIHKDMEKKLRL